MKTLHLTLKKKWFEMIASGEKKEEYRDIKPYWLNRLMYYHSASGIKLNIEELREACCDISSACQSSYDFTEDLEHHLDNWYLKFNDFDQIQFRNGYSKDAPALTIEFRGIEIREGRPEWGAVKGEKYFVIKLGKRIT